MKRICLTIHSAVVLLLGSLGHSLATSVVFQRHTADGAFFQLEAEAAKASEGATTSGVSGTNVVHYVLSGTTGILWHCDLPAYTTNPKSLTGFHFLDLTTVTNDLFLCYKKGRVTFVERVRVQADHAATAHESPVELNSDSDISGGTVTCAVFAETNGVPLLRLGSSQCRVKAWLYQNSAWMRATQYDLSIPPWFRPIDFSNPKLPGGPIREVFPAGDYTDAHWGEAKGGFQLGLRFKQAVYPAGECVIAMLHVRNTTNQALSYEMSTLSSQDGPIELIVHDKNNKLVESKASHLAPFIPLRTRKLDAGTQNIHGFRLSTQYSQFDLPSGRYTLTACLRIPRQASAMPLSVISGTASVEILPGQKAPLR